MCTIDGFDHVAITVADLERSCRFYDDLFGAKTVREGIVDGKVVVRQILIGGGAMLSIHQRGNGLMLVANRPTVGSADFCMRWSAPIETASTLLNGKGIPIIEGPVIRNNAFGASRLSVYFRDPDDNLVELMSTLES